MNGNEKERGQHTAVCSNCRIDALCFTGYHTTIVDLYHIYTVHTGDLRVVYVIIALDPGRTCL